MSVSAEQIKNYDVGDRVALVLKSGNEITGAIDSIGSKELAVRSEPSGFRMSVKLKDIESIEKAERKTPDPNAGSAIAEFEDRELHGRISEVNDDGLGGWIICDNGEKLGFYTEDADQAVLDCLSADYKNLGTFVRVSFIKDRKETYPGHYRNIASRISLDDDFKVAISKNGDLNELEFSERDGEIVGEIRLFNSVTEFGMIESADGANYQFLRRNGDAPFRYMLDYFAFDEIQGVRVAFLPKERRNVKGEVKPIADDIRLLSAEDIEKARACATETPDIAEWEPPSPDEELCGHINYVDLETRRCVIGGDDSRSYTLFFTKKEKALREFIETNPSDEVLGTRVAFQPIVEPGEDVRERGRAAKLRLLSEEEDPLNAIAQEALQLSIDGADEATQAELLAKANLLYSSGKRFHREAATLYQKLLDSGYRSPVILRRLVTLYAEFDQMLEMAELLKTRGDWFESKEKYLDLLLEIYEQKEMPAEALEVEMGLLEVVTKPTKRLSLMFSVAQSLFALERYEESLNYCCDWLTYKNGPQKALFQRQSESLSLTERSVAIFAASCISRLGHNPKPSILPLLEEYDEACEILNGTTSTSPDYYLEESARERITPAVYDLIQSADLQEAGVDIRRFDAGDDTYRGTIENAKADARRLTDDASSQRPHLRYRKCFAAAKLLLEAIRSHGVDDSECEYLLYSNIASALVSKADTLVGDESSDIGAARFLYLESLRYAGFYTQERVNATVRSMLSVCAERFDIPISMKGDGNVSLSNISQALDRAMDLDSRAVLNVLVRVYRNSLPDIRKKALERLCAEICESNKAETVARFLADALPFEVKDIPLSPQKMAQAVQDYYGQAFIIAQTGWTRSVKQMRGMDISPMGLKEAADTFSSLDYFVQHVDDCERDRFNQIRRMLVSMAEYYVQDSFGNKEAKLKDILAQTRSFITTVTSGPTEYAYEYLLPLVRRWNAAFAKMLDELYASSQPRLRCDAVQVEVRLDSDNRVQVQLDITNDEESQTADSVALRIAESSDYIVENVPDRRYYIQGGKGETVAVSLRLLDPALKAIALTIELECDSLADASRKSHQSFEENVTFILGEDEFHQLDNPYSAYVKSGVVQDEEMVFGRAQFINEVIESVRGTEGSPLRRKTIALYGQKRTGKSTVLYHLGKKLIEESPTTVVISLGDISKWAKEAFERKLYREFFKRLNKELDSHHVELRDALLERQVEIPTHKDIVDAIQGRDVFGDFMDEFNELIEEEEAFSSYNIAVLLDEFTNIYMYLCRGQIDRDFMQYWKAITNDYGLVGIVVGQDYMPDFVGAYPNPFGAVDSRLVTYLPEPEARRMITAPRASSKGHHAVFSGSAGERAIRRIMDLTACSAFFLMITMDRLIRYLNTKERAYVADSDIQTLLQDDLLSGSGCLSKDEFESLYNDDSDIADPERPRHNMLVLWLVARKAKALGSCKLIDIVTSIELNREGLDENRVAMLLNRLVARGVLTTDAGGNYSIRVGLLQEWLYRNCSIEVVESIKDVQS